MASNVKVNGTWKSTATVYTKVNGTWKTVTNAYTKVNGTWKQWLAPAPSYYAAPVYYAGGGGGGGSYPNIGSITAYGAGTGQTWTTNQAYITWSGSGWGSYTVVASNGSSNNSATSAGGPPVLLSGFSAGTSYTVTVTLYANANYGGTSASSSGSFTTAAGSGGGGGTIYYTVPNVVGLTPSSASSQITGSGNYYGGSSTTSSGATAGNDGTVASQNPASGTYTSAQTVSVTTYAYTAPPPAKTVTSDTTSTGCNTVAACPSGYENIRTIRYSDGTADYLQVCCTPLPPQYYAATVIYNPPIVYYAPNTTVTYYTPPQYYASTVIYNPPVTYYAPNTSVSYYAPSYYGGGGGCWAYGTEVTMADGTIKHIEELLVGDEVRTAVIPTYPNGEDSSKWYPASVWSTTNENITYESTKVTNARHVIDASYYILNDSYKVTGDHFVYIRRNKIWQFSLVEAIEVGDYLRHEFGTIEVKKKIYKQEQVMVVDIDVEPNDLFFANGIITHNFKGKVAM